MNNLRQTNRSRAKQGADQGVQSNRLTVGMLSYAERVSGQGVASAYREAVNLLKDRGTADLDCLENPSSSVLTRCDICHVHSINPSLFLKAGDFKRKKPNAPLVVSVHFLPETLRGSIKLPGPAQRVLEWYTLRFYRQADWLMTVNPYFKEKLIELGFPADKIVVIPNYVDAYSFQEALRQRCKEEGDLADEGRLRRAPHERLRVLGAGQVQTRKGVLDFLNVAQQMPEVDFLWAGGFSFGRITDGYEELAKAVENPPQNVQFLGIVPREQMPQIYAQADVMWLPSYSELFPMTILESFASGLPVLVRDLDLYKVIVDGNVLTAGNNAEFQSVLRKLASDKGAYVRACEMSEDGARRYSPQTVYDQWLRFYRHIAHDNAGATPSHVESAKDCDCSAYTSDLGIF